MLTYAAVISLMEHACNFNVRPEHDLWNTLNQAGQALFTAHDWPWLMSDPVDVPTRANTQQVTLPEDFAAPIEIVPVNGPSETISLVTAVQFMRLQQYPVGGGASFALYIKSDRSVTVGSERKIGLIHPLPTGDGQPTLRMVYRRRWVWASKETDANKVIPIPPEFGRAFQLIAQGMAVSTEQEDDAPTAYSAEAEAEVKRLAGHDARLQPNRGVLRGGWAEQALRRRSEQIVFDGPIQVAAP